MNETDTGTEYLVASESVALEGLGFKFVRDVAPGEAVFIDIDGNFYAQQCAERRNAESVHLRVRLLRASRLGHGRRQRLQLPSENGRASGEKIRKQIRTGDIDVVMPIPDTSRPAAMQLAMKLGLEFREGFFKNRYVGRTFIMPGQAVRKKSVRQKLSALPTEFKGKNVLLVDDSIVRGTTSREIVNIAREAGANKVIFASAAPPVRYPNVYGIDMPTRNELIAHGRSDEEIRRLIESDGLVYQDIDAMKRSVSELSPHLTSFEASCFDGVYVTGDVTPDYLDRLEAARELAAIQAITSLATESKPDGSADDDRVDHFTLRTRRFELSLRAPQQIRLKRG